ncbi:MAG TPA: hypothetical protein PKC43_01435 [Phycisphaerales bacterium]|nr:hypothetical protein [Phycisphaerales bacterium]HMP36088.1 hypothetical protein [Phycisphaerales bacterium]
MTRAAIGIDELERPGREEGATEGIYPAARRETISPRPPGAGAPGHRGAVVACGDESGGDGDAALRLERNTPGDRARAGRERQSI